MVNVVFLIIRVIPALLTTPEALPILPVPLILNVGKTEVAGQV
jgi:hypothetical protein